MHMYLTLQRRNPMRRHLTRCLIFLMILVLLPISVLADSPYVKDGKLTDLCWAALHGHHATNRSTTIYADKYLTEPITTVPARTIINNTPPGASYFAHEVEIRENNGVTYEHTVWGALYVRYFTYPDGHTGYGWIDSRTLTSAYTQKGQHLLMVSLDLDGVYDKWYYTETFDKKDPLLSGMSSDSPVVWSPGDTPGEEHGNEESNTPAESSPSPAASPASSSSTSTDKSSRSRTRSTSNQGTAVSIVQLGVYQSIIKVGGEKKEVLTRELTFAPDVPEGKRIAVIHAPKTGKCSLLDKASEKGKLIKRCKAGTLVYVLEYSRKYCRISYDGKEGWVLTSCLKFFDSSAEPIGEGVLTYNGKATGRTTINVRNNPDSSAAVIDDWRTGTTVIVFGLKNGWYEIEHNGMHGYVMQKYLTMKE